MEGLLGTKLGMTQVYDPAGRRVAVTVIAAGPCAVVQRKTRARDGYDAVQLGFETVAARQLTKPLAARCAAAGVTPCRHLAEFGLDAGEDATPGARVDVGIFEGVATVDISGVTKGRGFQGVVKRYRMAGGPMTHGGHSKRRVGSIGQCSYPARVARGQRMPGHMGHTRVTVQNLRVVALRPDESVMLVQGAVPGPTGALLSIRKGMRHRAGLSRAAKGAGR